MALIDLQRSVVEVCFGLEPRAEQLAALGNERIFRIYRDAIRKRLRAELGVAFKRTFATAGEAAVERAFAHFLDDSPPRTRFFHAVVGSFAQSAVPFFEREPGLPSHVADLCAYEAALWAVADLPDSLSEQVLEFGFDKQAVLAPALRLLALRHAVHVTPEPELGYAPGAYYLCVHRRPEEKRARPWTLNAVSFELMQRFVTDGTTVAEAVQQVAALRGIAVDQNFLDGLCTVLADFIERGVILGGR